MAPRCEQEVVKKQLSGAQKRRIKKLQGDFDASVLLAKREDDRKRAARTYIKNCQLIDQIKMSRGCADCGYNRHPAALDFDHLPGSVKIETLSRLRSYQWGSTARILMEIKKCEVVCANCHRIRTIERKRQQRVA